MSGAPWAYEVQVWNASQPACRETVASFSSSVEGQKQGYGSHAFASLMLFR